MHRLASDSGTKCVVVEWLRRSLMQLKMLFGLVAIAGFCASGYTLEMAPRNNRAVDLARTEDGT